METAPPPDLVHEFPPPKQPRRSWVSRLATGAVFFGLFGLEGWIDEFFPTTLTVRCTSADGVPVAGVAFLLRSLEGQPFLSLNLRPAEADSDDPTLFRARASKLQTDDDAEGWFRSGPKLLVATSESHGQLITTIDRDGPELRFERTATVHLKYDPPLDESELERRYVEAIRDPHIPFQSIKFDIADRLNDGVITLGPLQPGEHHFVLGRRPRPRPPGTFGGSYGRRGSNRHAKPYSLVSGTNEITIYRK
jgi:hypothetical protein